MVVDSPPHSINFLNFTCRTQDPGKMTNGQLSPQWLIYIVKFWMRAPSLGPIFFISCSSGKFWPNNRLAPPFRVGTSSGKSLCSLFHAVFKNFGRMVYWRPLEGWRPFLGESWIRPCGHTNPGSATKNLTTWKILMYAHC